MYNIQNISLFRALSENEIHELAAASKEVIYKRKETIIKHGNMPLSVGFVTEGLVKMYDEYPGNRTHILHIIKSNEFIDIFSVFSELPYHFSASALMDSKIFMFDRSVIMKIASQNPAFAAATLRYLSVVSIFLLRNTIDLYRKNLKGRLAFLLLYLSRDVFYSKSFRLPLSGNEIADFTSISRENISRTMSEFNNEKIISYSKHVVTILNEPLLEKISDFG